MSNPYNPLTAQQDMVQTDHDDGKEVVMRSKSAMLISAGVSAGLMYLLDPDRGRRRRALLRDKATHFSSKTTDTFDKTSKDVLNRVRGLRADFRGWVGGDQVSDDVIQERVRATVGRSVSHPGSIEVRVESGHVALGGPILANEVGVLLRQVWRVRGVKSVQDLLEAHSEPGNIPGLQGEPSVIRAGGSRFPFLQSNWSPTARLVAGAMGGLAAGYALRRRNPFGLLLGLGGAVLFARAASNVELSRLTGIRAGRRGVEIRKTAHFNAPIERVFALWSNFQDFPQFMANVREVRKVAEGQWRWTVTGPMGRPVEFDAEVSAMEPNRLIAWRTLEDSPICHSGVVNFEPQADGTTTVDIHFTYNPVAGALGHALAKMFRADPKRQMNDDLMRMKGYLETGRAPHDAAARVVHH